MWQLWLFIAPGLYANEKQLAMPFVLFSIGFFVGGAAFSHYVVSSRRRGSSSRASPTITWSSCRASSRLRALREDAAGLRADLPDADAGVRPGADRPGDGGLPVRNMKYAILIIFIIAAVLTPGDVVRQVLDGGPMFVLYLLSIGIAWIFGKKARGRRASDADAVLTLANLTVKFDFSAVAALPSWPVRLLRPFTGGWPVMRHLFAGWPWAWRSAPARVPSEGADARQSEPADRSETRPPPRPVFGDTGLWFVPTGEVLPPSRVAQRLSS